MGACRLCIVEVSGVGRLLPACTTPVQDGMSVTTNSEKLTHYRRIAIEFLFSERNHHAPCASPTTTASCRPWRRSSGVTSVRYPYSYPKLPVDVSHERFVLDHNRCILCTRCVRVCAEVEGAHVWDVSIARHPLHGRVRSEPRPGASRESCTNCGKCVQVCPTGALAEKGFAVEEMVKQRPQHHAPGRQARRPS